jgi:DinB superfamily
MDKSINESLWNQFGASMDMLENAITTCPVTLWDTELKFWYKAYHCIFWTDYFLSVEPNSFAPPTPFDLSEFDPSGVLPKQTFSKEELLLYLQHCRTKSHTRIQGLTYERLNQRWINQYKNYSLLEILLYNMRHIQHHSAQLNLLLRQNINDAPTWVSQAKPLTS